MVSFHAERVGTIARERCGGAGFLACNRLGQVITFSHAGTTAEGDNRVLFTKVAKEVLALIAKGKHQFPTVPLSGGGTHSQSIAIETATLSDLLYLFVSRERQLFLQLGSELKAKMSTGQKLFDVWMLESSDLIQASATALGSRIVLQQSMEVLGGYAAKYHNGAQDVKTESVLRALLALYALRRIEIDLAWFLTSQTLTLAQGKAVSERVRALCKEIAPYALSLVQGFGIPDHLCIAPIAQDWVKYNETDECGEVKDNMSFFHARGQQRQ